MNAGGVGQRHATVGELDPADIHDVLRNDRRRLVIERLREANGVETVRDLSEHIATIESGESPAPRNVRQSVYVSLHQTHLPKLDELGIISYDSDGKNVRLAERADEVAVYMEVAPTYGLSWGEYYLAISLVGLVLVLGAEVGLPVLSSLGGGVLGGLALLVLAVVTAYQVASQRGVFEGEPDD